MRSKFDLDRAVASLVETAKRNLQRDGRLQPVGIMFLPGQVKEIVPSSPARRRTPRWTCSSAWRRPRRHWRW